MDALTATGGNQIGVPPVFVLNTATLGAGFLNNFINVLMPPNPASIVTDAPPKQIAAALIRSMLRAAADTSETPPQQKQRREQASPQVPVPLIALSPIALPAQTPVPAVPVAPAAALKEAAPQKIPSLRDTIQTHVATLPAGLTAPPAPAKTASHSQLAFGAVLTRLDAKPAPAPAALVSINPESVPPATQGKQLPPTQGAPPQPPQSPSSPAPAEQKTKPASPDREDAGAHPTAAPASTNSTAGHGTDFIRTVSASATNANAANSSSGGVSPVNASMETRMLPPDLAAPQRTISAVESSGPTAAAAGRGSEPVQPIAAPPPRGSSAQEIAVRIAQPDVPSVDLHVTERNGQVQVAVRTPDAGLQTALRQDLGTLVNSLERAGYHSSVFTPQGIQGSSAGEANSKGGREGDRQNWHNASPGRDSGASSGGRQQQHQRGQDSQDWLEELENQP